MMSLRRFLAAALLLGLGIGRASADTVFDTASLWDNTTSISPFGFPDTATYGQTFIAPTDNVLQDFTFYVGGGAAHVEMKGMVFEWTGSLFGGGGGKATGPALFTSSTIVLDATNAFQAVTVSTGGLTLNTGTSYVALLTISDPTDYANSTGTTQWGRLPGHTSNNGGGGFVFFNNGNNFSALGTQTWDNFGDFGDSAWTARFSPNAVPEPSSLAMLGGGVAGLVGWARRRRGVRPESSVVGPPRRSA